MKYHEILRWTKFLFGENKSITNDYGDSEKV